MLNRMDDMMSDADSSSSNASCVQKQSAKGKFGILANVDDEELKSIRVAIRRKGFPNSGNLSPIRRDIDDPITLSQMFNNVSSKGKDDSRLLFDRSEVIVNQYKCLNSDNTMFVVPKCVRSRSSNCASSSSFSNYKTKQFKKNDNVPAESKDYTTNSRNERDRDSTSPSDRFSKYEGERRSSSYTSNEHTCNKCGINGRSRSPSRSDDERPGPSVTRRRKRSRSGSPKPSSSHRHVSRSRELSPLRPGEYRAGYPRPTTESRSRSKSPPDYRRRNHLPQHPHNMAMRPPYRPAFLPRSIVQTQPIFIPYVLQPAQIPIPRQPARWIRPARIYNNRPIPNFVSSANSTGTNSNCSSASSSTSSSSTSEQEPQIIE